MAYEKNILRMRAARWAMTAHRRALDRPDDSGRVGDCRELLTDLLLYVDGIGYDYIEVCALALGMAGFDLQTAREAEHG